MAPIVDNPGTYNFSIYAGATFARTLTLGTAIDLSAYDGRMMLRESYTAGSAVLSLGTASGITLGTAGTIEIDITDAQTTALGSAAGNATTQYVYDLELDDGTDVTRLLQGVATIFPEATR
jgi:hypothetical protein